MTSYPETVKVFLQLQDGVDYVIAQHSNDRGDEITAEQTFIGASGIGQSHSTDLLNMLLDNYVGGKCYGISGTTDEIYVEKFAGIIANAAGTIKKLRKKSTVTTLTAADLDTGTMAVGYYYIYATAESAGTEPVYVFSASASAPSGYTYYRKIGWFYNETASVLDVTKLQVSSFTGGGNINSVEYQTGAVDTGITAFPDDDTNPEITEGDEYMTLVYVPTSEKEKIRISVVCYISHGSNATTGCGLFQDAITNALKASQLHAVAAGLMCHNFTHSMVSGTTSPIVFRVRAGGAAGATTTFNGVSGSRKLGDALASSLKIEKIG